MKKTIITVASISSSTTKSLCLLCSPFYPYPYSISEGPGLNPLEFSYKEFFSNFKKISFEAVEKFYRNITNKNVQIKISKLSLSMEGLHFDQDKKYVIECLSDLPISPNAKDDIFIIDRGMACIIAGTLEAYGSLIKIGTSAFAYCCFPSFEDNNKIISNRIGGWGIFTGYDGGGYDIGRCGIYRVFDELEGRKPNTNFIKHFKDAIGIKELNELANFIKNAALKGALRKEISELAGAIVFIAEYEKNDVAIEMLHHAGERIYNNYCLLLNNLSEREKNAIIKKPLLISGGLIANSVELSKYLYTKLKNKWPNATIKLKPKKAILGNLNKCLNKLNLDKHEIESIVHRLIEKDVKLLKNYPKEILNIFD